MPHKAPFHQEIDLVPLTLFSQRIAEGWRMVPGYPLNPGDWAVTMMPPGFPKPRSNISRSAEHRANVTNRARRERALARMVEPA